MVGFRFVLFMVFALFMSFGCQQSGSVKGKAETKTDKREEILIGASGPMTGDQSKMGHDMKNAIELAVSQWNAKGGVLGKKIRVMFEDDQHDPKQAVSVANKLVNSGVVGVIGHWNSSASIPASAVYHRGNVIMITPASTNPTLTEQGFYNVFRVCGRDDQQGAVAAEFVQKSLKVKRIAILHDKTTYGQGLAKEFRKSLKDSYEIIEFAGIVQGDKDFRGILTRVISNKPDLLFFGGIYPEAGLLVRQSRELGYSGMILSGDGVIDEKFIEIAGAAAEGTYLTFSPDPENIPFAKEFLAKYHKEYGQHGPYSIYAYDATNVLLKGLEDAGTVDAHKVSDAIKKMTYDGALGRLEFDERGDVSKSPYIIWRTRNGKFEEYWKPGAS